MKKNNRGWRGEPVRHGLSSKGIRTAVTKEEAVHKVPVAPLSSKSDKFPIQFSINVPSTELDESVSPVEYKRRIKETATEFSNLFGGDTAIKGKGDYTYEGELISEDVTIIESSMSLEDYRDHKEEIEDFIKCKRKDWKQDTIGYKFEGDFFMYPKEKKK